MHILFIPTWYETPSHPTAGKAVKDVALGLLESYTSLQINFLFQSPEKLSVYQENEKKFQIWHSQYPYRGKIYPILNYFAINEFINVFDKYQKKNGLPDLVHVHSYPALLFANVLFDNYKIPFIYTEHSSRIGLSLLNIYEKWFIKKYTVNSTVNTAVSKHLANAVHQIINSSIQVIPNTIDFNYFGPGSRNNVDQICMIGLLHANKRIDLGIKAFAEWSKNKPNASLNIIGEGPERNNLEMVVKKLNIYHKVRFYGEMSPDQWLPILQSSSVVLSMSKYETFGVVPYEALACHIPVVCTRNKGIDEYSILESEIVLLNESFTLQEVGISIKQAIENKSKINWIRVRNYIHTLFGYKTISDRYHKIYESITSN